MRRGVVLCRAMLQSYVSPRPGYLGFRPLSHHRSGLFGLACAPGPRRIASTSAYTLRRPERHARSHRVFVLSPPPRSLGVYPSRAPTSPRSKIFSVLRKSHPEAKISILKPFSRWTLRQWNGIRRTRDHLSGLPTHLAEKAQGAHQKLMRFAGCRLAHPRKEALLTI
jgi:hypothetical protein